MLFARSSGKYWAPVILNSFQGEKKKGGVRIGERNLHIASEVAIRENRPPVYEEAKSCEAMLEGKIGKIKHLFSGRAL